MARALRTPRPPPAFGAWKGLVVLALLSSTALAGPSQNPQAALELGKSAYARHSYKEVEEAIAPLLKNNELGTEEAVIEAHRLLALSYFFLRREAEAGKEVKALLLLRPNFQLDAFVESPVAVHFFENIRNSQEQQMEDFKKRQIEEDEQLRKEEERRRLAARAKAEKVYIEKTVERHSRLLAMVPFGVGQIQNGHKGLAVMFGVTEGLLGALSLSMWITIQQRFPGSVTQPDRDNKPGDQGLATTLTALQLASGAAFWVMVVAGIIDAQVKLVPVVVRTKDLPSQPPPKKTTWIMGPIISPSFYGIGAQGAF